MPAHSCALTVVLEKVGEVKNQRMREAKFEKSINGECKREKSEVGLGQEGPLETEAARTAQ